MLPVPPPLSRSHALFLDFDGTLAPIQDDPDSVSLPGCGAAILAGVDTRLEGALAVISGRSLADLSSRIPDKHWRLGAHGLGVAAPGQSVSDSESKGPIGLVEQLGQLASQHAGARLEPKGAVIALHYRQAADKGALLEQAMQDILRAYPDYRLQSGKMVLEAKPTSANKGRALDEMLHRAPFEGRTPIMVGDDTTDEDAMAVAVARGGLAVKVGSGPTCAQYRLSDPDAVWSWLEEFTR